jgi:hypothetical protein
MSARDIPRLKIGKITPSAVILKTQFIVRYALVRAKKGPRTTRKYRLPPEIKVVQVPVSSLGRGRHKPYFHLDEAE